MAKAELDILHAINVELKGFAKIHAKLEATLTKVRKLCRHKVQGETPDGGGRYKLRVCLQCGAEQESMATMYWWPATETFHKGGEYDDGDYHYKVEARLDKVKNPTILHITWEELYRFREAIET